MTNRLLCLLTVFVIASTVRLSVCEYKVYLEVIDDEGFMEKWTHIANDLNVDMVHDTAGLLLRNAFQRRYSHPGRNVSHSVQHSKSKHTHSQESTSKPETATDSKQKWGKSTTDLTPETSGSEPVELENAAESSGSEPDAVVPPEFKDPFASEKEIYEEEVEEQVLRRKKRASEQCKDRKGNSPVITGYISEPRRVVTLPCHFCDDTNREIRKAKVWFKFVRDNFGGETVFHAEQVKLDTHDDVRLNRIYTLPDHTLVISNFQPSDTGAYFCESYNALTSERAQPFSFRTSTIDESSAAAILVAWKTVAGSTSITFMSLVDIVLPIDSDLVSHSLAAYKRPSRPLKNSAANWITYMEWGGWSECSRCGDEGDRRRHGHCRIRKIDDSMEAKPAYLDEVLKLYPRGAACQSSLFTEQSLLKDARNEIEVGPCNLPCKQLGGVLGISLKKTRPSEVLRRREVYYRPEMNTVLPNTQQGMQKATGEAVTLFCPGIYDDSSVVWKKNFEVIDEAKLQANSSSEIRIDQYYRIVFKNLQQEDSGQYSCYVDFQVTVDYFLEVMAPIEEVGDWTPGIYYLFACYFAAFIVFTFVAVIKHAQRFDSTRARAYRTRTAAYRGKGYASYAEIYGEHARQRNYSRNANVSANANSGNSSSHTSEDEVVIDLSHLKSSLEIGRHPSSIDLSEELSSVTRSLGTKGSSERSASKTHSTVESGSDAIDLSSTDDEYGILESSSDWEIDSNYSDTGEDSDIPLKPYWLL